MKKQLLAGCVILQNNSILLIKRKKTGWFELPGGKVEANETPAIAAKRELKEELNCDVEIIKEIGKHEFEENKKTFLYTWFLARIKENQKLEILEKETFEKFEYIPLNKLSSHTLSPNMQNLITIL